MKNQASKYAMGLFKSDLSKLNSQLISDFESIIDGNCIYLPNFFCKKDDFSILLSLSEDMRNANSGMINWSKHFKYENPNFSKTFQMIIKKLEEHFDFEVYHTRINFYKDGRDWKPYHHDSHAYGNKQYREDFTVGVSFGASRELSFLHEDSDQVFSFPQNNGDIFAFTNTINKKFMHGVPKSTKVDIGPRFSIIAWGRRRNITDVIDLETNSNYEDVNEEHNNNEIEFKFTGNDIYNLVKNYIDKINKPIKDRKRTNKGRLQHSWHKSFKDKV